MSIYVFYKSLLAILETISTNTTLEDSDIWYGETIQNVKWDSVVREVAPFLSYTDRYTLLEIAGTDALSPALILTTAIYYKNEKKISFKSHIESMSVRLMQAFYNSTGRTNEQKVKENDATHTISLFVGRDTKQMNEIIAILKAIKIEAIKHQITSDDTSSDSSAIKRGTGDETSLRFPFNNYECWMFSATHHSNEQCSSRSCPKSSLDLAPNLFMGYGYDFRYFESEGEVIAAHSGYIHVHSPCKLQVKSTQFTTFYSHIRISKRSGDYVRVGDHLGYIEIEREAANCNCEVEAGRTECSTCPHLHWEVRDLGNKPLDLDGMMVSGFEIHTGSESYDFGCSSEECHNNMTLEEIKHSCSTVFRRLVDNTTFCPSVQGANWGMTSIICLIYQEIHNVKMQEVLVSF